MSMPAGIFLFVLKMLANENEEYQKKIDKFDFAKIFDTYQIKDAINATDLFFKTLFETKASLSYNEFKSLIMNNDDIQCILYPGSVRRFLEKNNV